MKTFLLFFLSTAPLLAQEAPPSDKSAPVAATAVGQDSRTLFSIDPKGRSGDWAQAFDLLRKDKPTLKIFVRLTNGPMLLNVAEISSSMGGTLLFIKTPSNQGTRMIPIPVENVQEIGYSP
jgi:hypothetical protein